MPIDEFGREIPAAGGRDANLSSSSNPFTDPLRHPRRDHHDEPPPPSEGGLDGELKARRGSPRGGGGRNRRGGGSRSPERRRENNDDDRDGDGDDGGGVGRRRRGGRGKGGGRNRSDSSGYDDRRHRSGGRRHRSRSYGDDRDDGGHHHGGRHRGGGSSGGRSRGTSAPSQGRAKAHASERYAEQPMLCQFVWKKELEEEHAKELRQKGGSDGGTARGGDDPSMEDVNEANDENAPPPLFNTPEAEAEAYAEYNAKYCLNYVRTFFNHHLDDPWFRARLSPLEAYRRAQREQTRATAEANEFRKEILQSLDDMNSGVIPKKDPDCADYLGPPKCNFVASCRLGVGTKPTNRGQDAHHHHGYDPYRPESRERENETDMQHDVLRGEDRNRIERHAKSHLHSFIKSESCVKVMDVPPGVSDGQLLAALSLYCATAKDPGREPPLAVWGDAVRVPTRGGGGGDAGGADPYHRAAYVVFPSAAARDAMLESLHRANDDADRGRGRGDRGGGEDRCRVVGRKGEVLTLPRVLDLDLDCTDVYGRREADADGRGGAPPPTASAGGAGGKKKDGDGRLPTRKCTVFVSTAPLAPSQPVSVLSAAVSSRGRIARDREVATKVAATLDEVREIGAGSHLADLLMLLYPGNELHSVDDEDILDISIAYLRRVHLFSFYNGCTAASDVGDVLSFFHPAGTIHLRLRDADEILTKMAEEKANYGAPAPMFVDGVEGDVVKREDAGGAADETKLEAAKDMLVTRLNDSIDKALEHAKVLGEQGPSCLIDAETDTAAHTIAAAEERAREEWIKNHGILDQDGRARCSFHFCRKLFKDKAFLHKHLLKKHSDQLRAECAKCHDGPMMAAWDADARRPVPPVLVDCGSKFGLVPSNVVGSDQPLAEDPEPALWRAELERQAEEESRRREREAAARAAEEDEERRRREAANAGEKRKSNFVDPDDMVEEKVELSFEEVAPPPPKKKKKKKKKSLL